MATAPVFDPQRFLDSLLHRPREIEGSSDVLSHNGVNLYPKPTSEEDALYQLPADRLYELPDFVEVCGARSKLMAQALGDPFLVFEGRLAKQFAEHFRLTFDANREVPRPSGIAGTLDVYVQQPDGSWTVLDEDDDVEALVACGAVYDDLYYAYEETPGDTVVFQRWLIAYESSRFPGFTLLGNKHDGYWTDETVRALTERELERRGEEQQIYDAFNALRFPDRSDAGPDAPFDDRRRQQFLIEPFYEAAVRNIDELAPDLRGYLDGPAGDAEDRRGWSFYLAVDSYRRWSLRYTAGEPIEALRTELTGVIEAYEHYQKALAEYEQIPEIAPLGMGNIGDYERCMQLVGLCYLLHRRDLLPRIAALEDPGYEGEDALYEDLLAYELPDRTETDELLHLDLYDPLLGAMYGATDEESEQYVEEYVNHWYSAFKYIPWHDGHLRIDGTDGDYFGYWAFEAGAVAFLCNIDDSAITHMVYPKDLAAWCRANKHLSEQSAPSGTSLRVPGGETCPKAGWWHTPAARNSRRYFNQGDTLPSIEGSSYGDTYWLWDANQDRPRL